jgi:hypothetical protein
MKMIAKLRKHNYLARIGVFLIAIALIAGTVSCEDDGAQRYTLTMATNPLAGGTVVDLTGGSPYLANASVNITATAMPGYLFTIWSAPAGAFGNPAAATTTFTMPDQDVTVTANFAFTPSLLLDHFKGYFASNTTEWLNITGVHLEDQFGAVNATILAPWGFVNPAEKQHAGNVTPILNNTHHYTVYDIMYGEMPQNRTVEVLNQFGLQNLNVSGPVSLAVPTQKQGHAAPVGLDHYLIYEVVLAPSQGVAINLTDQFGGDPEVTVFEALYFANPVKKTYKGNVTDIVYPDVHLVAYGIVGMGMQTQIQVDNQFGNQTLDLVGPISITVPSDKLDYSFWIP